MLHRRRIDSRPPSWEAAAALIALEWLTLPLFAMLAILGLALAILWDRLR